MGLQLKTHVRAKRIGILIIEILEILVIVLVDKTRSTTTKAAPQYRRSSPMRGAHGGPST